MRSVAFLWWIVATKNDPHLGEDRACCEPRAFILGEIRDADRPLGSREIAQGIVELQGYDAKDRNYVTQLTRRVSKALRILKVEGLVRSAPPAEPLFGRGLITKAALDVTARDASQDAACED